MTTRHAMLLILNSCMYAAGCTTESWYEGMKSGHKNTCLTAPESEYEQCIREHDDSYDVYQLERDQAISGSERLPPC